MVTSKDEETAVPGEPGNPAGEADPAPTVGPTEGGRAAGRIREAAAEAAQRGAPMVSAQAVQAKLFQVYDDAADVPEALALVQRHLRLTLDRTWYSAQEIDDLADQLDWLLGLGPGGAEAGAGGPGVDEAAAAPAG